MGGKAELAMYIPPAPNDPKLLRQVVEYVQRIDHDTLVRLRDALAGYMSLPETYMAIRKDSIERDQLFTDLLRFALVAGLEDLRDLRDAATDFAENQPSCSEPLDLRLVFPGDCA